MASDEVEEPLFDEEPEPVDSAEEEAVGVLTEFFEENSDKVFYFRQIEVLNEDRFYHWITNRALHRVVGSVVRMEEVNRSSGAPMMTVWHKSLRYYRREQARLIKLVEQYSDPNVGAALGLNGEFIVLEGFARRLFVMKGRETRRYGQREWDDSKQNVDFIFEKDGVAYGVEVKNQLRYPEHDEILAKARMCEFLGIKPVFVVRMMPKDWVNELRLIGGFTLILKYQLYPVSHAPIARRGKLLLRHRPISGGRSDSSGSQGTGIAGGYAEKVSGFDDG
jgi:hypothetical protein